MLLPALLSPATLTSALLAVDDHPWNHEFGITKVFVPDYWMHGAVVKR
jgi:hypothetical protein